MSSDKYRIETLEAKFSALVDCVDIAMYHVSHHLPSTYNAITGIMSKLRDDCAYLEVEEILKRVQEQCALDSTVESITSAEISSAMRLTLRVIAASDKPLPFTVELPLLESEALLLQWKFRKDRYLPKAIIWQGSDGDRRVCNVPSDMSAFPPNELLKYISRKEFLLTLGEVLEQHGFERIHFTIPVAANLVIEQLPESGSQLRYGMADPQLYVDSEDGVLYYKLSDFTERVAWNDLSTVEQQRIYYDLKVKESAV